MSQQYRVDLYSKNDTRLTEAEGWSTYRGWNPLKRLRLVQQSVWNLASYLRFQNPLLIREIVWQELERNQRAPFGNSSKPDTSTPAGTQDFYLTLQESSMATSEAIRVPLVLTENQVAILSRITSRATKVLCSLVDLRGNRREVVTSGTLILRDGIQPDSSNLPTPGVSGRVGEDELATLRQRAALADEAREEVILDLAAGGYSSVPLKSKERHARDWLEHYDALSTSEAKARMADEISAQIARDGEASGGIPWAWYMRWRAAFDALSAPASDPGSEVGK